MNKFLRTSVLLCFILLSFTTAVYAQSTDIYAVVTAVDAPTTVEPGASVKVTVSVEYNFPEQTNAVVGIYDPESWEAIQEMEFDDQGNYESGFELEIIAPEEEGTYQLAADIYYLGEGGYTYTDGSEQLFSITVKKAGFSIPGFPLGALLVGLAAVLYRKD